MDAPTLEPWLYQVILLILLLTGWLSFWKQLVNPTIQKWLWPILLAQLIFTLFIVEFSSLLAMNIGGFLFPACFPFFFVQKNHVTWLRTPAAIILISTALWSLKEFIRINPVFWVISETWSVGLFTVFVSFLLGTTFFERWVLLTSSLFLGQFVFLLIHFPDYTYLRLGDRDFQLTWWHGVWLGIWLTYFPFYWAKCKYVFLSGQRIFQKRVFGQLKTLKKQESKRARV